MISIVFIFLGVVAALAVFAILAKTCAGEPKRAEKREKGEILKQLLALSEREDNISEIASPPPRSLRVASASATGNEALQKRGIGSTILSEGTPRVPTLLSHSDQA